MDRLEHPRHFLDLRLRHGREHVAVEVHRRPMNCCSGSGVTSCSTAPIIAPAVRTLCDSDRPRWTWHESAQARCGSRRCGRLIVNQPAGRDNWSPFHGRTWCRAACPSPVRQPGRPLPAGCGVGSSASPADSGGGPRRPGGAFGGSIAPPALLPSPVRAGRPSRRARRCGRRARPRSPGARGGPSRGPQTASDCLPETTDLP